VSKRVAFYGTPVDLLDMQMTLAMVEMAMREGKPLRHTALNVAKLVNMRKDDDLAADVAASDIVGIDGMGIAFGLRLFGMGKQERVTGVDLMLEVLALCARTGRKPYILGARQDQLETAIANAQKLFPGLEMAGSHNGYFRPEKADDVVQAISQSGADCLFVAMPTPLKERFLAQYASVLAVPFVMGVGGSVDVLAGHVSRAPKWMQDTGLEWLHRLLQEPRKMLARYARTNVIYLAMLIGSLLTFRNPVAETEIGDWQ